MPSKTTTWTFSTTLATGLLMAVTLVGWGMAVASIRQTAVAAHVMALHVDDACHTNKETIIKIQGDIQYIKKAVTDIKLELKNNKKG